MTFSMTTTMAAAALLAVLFLGASTTYAAPVPESVTDAASYTGGKVVGTVVGGVVDPVAPKVIEGGLDGDRYIQNGDDPVHDAGDDFLSSLQYDVGDALGTFGSQTLAGRLRDGGVDGVTQSTGKD
ncbi:hypothetical protein BGW39_010963 [Mortierella sp. 14UC]|nr:hypothetical protein BGW39_010963 [Mortierella sp. 14UC]